MRVGILDSGFSGAWLQPGNIRLESFSTWSLEVDRQGWKVTGRISEPDEIARWWLEEGQPEPCWDSCGHGSLVTRTIMEGPRPLSLVLAQVLDFQGRGHEAVLLAAWDWIMGQKPDVVNFSLGCHSSHPQLWETRIKEGLEAGTAFYAAAGGAPGYPACVPGVYAVADHRLRENPSLTPEWAAAISRWVGKEEFPVWAGEPSTSLACAVAVRDHVHSKGADDRPGCLG